MTGRTSSQQAREQEQQLAANDLFAVGFGDAGNVVAVEEEPEPPEIEAVEEIEAESEPDDNVMAAMLNAASVVGTSMPEPEEAPEAAFAASPYDDQTPSEPSGPPGGPPSPLQNEVTIEQQLPPLETPYEDNIPEPTRETNSIVSEALDLISSSSNKIQNLEHEINRLRAALSGSAEVISEIEEQPMPPLVGPDYVVPSHMVADFVRIGRQLHKEGLVHADVGAVAILNPDEAGLMHTSSKGAILGQMTEQHIASGRLGQTAPGNAPEQWRMLEVLIASKSLQTKGPAACIHTHPPFATAISCEKDLIVLKPIDKEGMTHLGNIVIVESDADNPDDYLRQLAEALKQGNMKAVVVRGHGVFSTGVDFDEAWRWASVIEHSMRVLMHARQANLQV
ncbi:MAG: class II aldolase/adducin family protein [Candidatus Poseidoniales archaeon]